jgi:hypothetical protein
VPVLAVTLRDGGYDLHDLRRTASATDCGASAPGHEQTLASIAGLKHSTAGSDQLLRRGPV